jgi:hypothetical protein
MENIGTQAPFSESGFSTPAKLEEAMGDCARAVTGTSARMSASFFTRRLLM